MVDYPIQRGTRKVNDGNEVVLKERDLGANKDPESLTLQNGKSNIIVSMSVNKTNNP